MSIDAKTVAQWEAREAARRAEADAAAVETIVPEPYVPPTIPQTIALPGVDQDVVAELDAELEAARTLRADFRLALFRTGKGEPRRRPLTPAERIRRRAAGRRSRVARRITRAAA